jgi:hypothetical protein
VPVPFEPSFTVERRCDPSPWTLLWRVLLQAWLVICYNELHSLDPRWCAPRNAFSGMAHLIALYFQRVAQWHRPVSMTWISLPREALRALPLNRVECERMGPDTSWRIPYRGCHRMRSLS